MLLGVRELWKAGAGAGFWWGWRKDGGSGIGVWFVMGVGARVGLGVGWMWREERRVGDRGNVGVGAWELRGDAANARAFLGNL